MLILACEKEAYHMDKRWSFSYSFVPSDEGKKNKIIKGLNQLQKEGSQLQFQVKDNALLIDTNTDLISIGLAENGTVTVIN